jgi:uncharacterized C2H2 Zn-finger protein
MIVLVEYRCPECDKRFNCPANLASHRRWHKPRSADHQNNNNDDDDDGDNVKKNKNVGSRYSCSICSKTFRMRQNLSKHVSRVHGGNEADQPVRPNISRDDQVDQEELICQVCSKAFQNLADLARHRSGSHSDTFPCKSCPEIFYSLAGLTRHNNRFHL